MKLYELLKVPSLDNSKSISASGISIDEIESIDFYTELSAAMYRVENQELQGLSYDRILWEFDEWGNLECYSLIEETKQDGAPDCVTWLYVCRYVGYMIKIIDVIN